MILTPRSFLRQAYQIWASEMVMVADFSAAHATEKALRVVAVDAIAEAIGFLMIDAVHREAAMQLVPCSGFIRLDLRALGDPGADEIECRDLGSEHAGERLAVALADHDHDQALA
jgi:hypothetical protein